MAASNINRVIITGNLTKDPDLRMLQNQNSVCKLRIANNTRRKDGDQWVDKPNYFDVTVWGAQGENCAKYLEKGRGVAIDGRLEWHEWQTQEGQTRSAVEIIADNVQFLGGGGGGGNGGGYGRQQQAESGGSYGGEQGGQQGGFTPQSDVPADQSDFNAPPPAAAPAAPPQGDDDIPF